MSGAYVTDIGFSGRATVPVTTGQKKYWEVVIGNGAPGESAVGIIGTGLSPPWANSNSETLLGEGQGGLAYTSDDRVWAQGAQRGAWAPYTDGDVIGVAVDFNNSLVWMRVNTGPWNNNGSADPATGVGGFTYSGFDISGDIYPAYQVYWSQSFSPNPNPAAPSTATGTFFAPSFAHTPPSGYTAIT